MKAAFANALSEKLRIGTIMSRYFASEPLNSIVSKRSSALHVCSSCDFQVFCTVSVTGFLLCAKEQGSCVNGLKIRLTRESRAVCGCVVITVITSAAYTISLSFCDTESLVEGPFVLLKENLSSDVVD